MLWVILHVRGLNTTGAYKHSHRFGFALDANTTADSNIAIGHNALGS